MGITIGSEALVTVSPSDLLIAAAHRKGVQADPRSAP
jgi:hypothetical protein